MPNRCQKEKEVTQGEGEEVEKAKTEMQHPNTMFATYA